MNNTEEIIKEYFKNFKQIQKIQVKKFFQLHPDIEIYINNILKNDLNWINTTNIINGIVKNKPLQICKICGNTIKYGYNKRKYCSLKCVALDKDKIQLTKIKFKNTCLKKYGVDNPSKLKQVQNKFKNTCLEKYGVDNPAKSKQIQEKFEKTCKEKYGVKNPQQHQQIKNKTKKTCKEKYDFENPALLMSWNNILSWKDYIIPMFSKEQFKGYTKNITYQWKCKLCGNIFKQKIYSTSHKTEIDMCLPRCQKCFPKTHGYSKQEKEVVAYIKSIYSGTVKENRYDIIPPYELDIILPQLNLAIEYNGDYWHSERNPKFNPEHDTIKVIKCKQIGFQLIYVWQHDWLNNKQEIKNILQNLIQKIINNINKK